MEAALLCPLLCLLLCLMVSMTLALYERVMEYGTECMRVLDEIGPTSELMRMERTAGDLWGK
ncbi:MAG: hypothetical protein ACI4FZ_00535 [Lachnospiraceae bacterium]